MFLHQNKAPNLQICEMVCDKPLHPKLENIELMKNLNHHSLTAFN